MKIDTNWIAKGSKSTIGNSYSPFSRKETLVGRFARTTLLLLFVLCSGMVSAQQEVTLTEAGTLSEKIGDDQKYTITSLKVSGPINGTDVKYLREMTGMDVNGNITEGKLADLDLTDANIVEGGESYYSDNYTTNNTLGDLMFYKCGLTNIKIPNSVTSIGEYAFSYCSSLTSVDIPNSVTSIGKYAFCECTGLTSVTIPNSVTSIGMSAFNGCSSLTSVTIPNSVTSIGEHAFSYCSSLTSIAVEEGNAHYHMDGNCLIETASNTLIRGCNLTSITIPNSVTSIGKGAFCDCSGLTSVTIPNSVTSIGDDAFYRCSGLTSVTIPNSVTSIGKYAFALCSNLTEVTLQGTALPSCVNNAFNQISKGATLYCKASLVETCKTTTPWSGFGEIKAIPFSVTITDAGISTACSNDDLDFSEMTDVKAYIASGFSPSEGKVLLTRAMKIPAKTGFIVKGNAGTYKIPVAATDYTYANLLVGTLAETTVAETDGDYTNYVLANDAVAGVGFYKANNTAVSANKAYLHIPTSAVATDGTSEAKASLKLSFDDEEGNTTGIIPVTKLAEETSGNAVIYNLNGQRKQGLTKGLNIVDGKKIFIR